jgi:hypothetical protein
MGIGIHNLSASADGAEEVVDLAAAIRQTAAGVLGTTVQLADLVRSFYFTPQHGLMSTNAGHSVCGWWVLIYRCRCSATHALGGEQKWGAGNPRGSCNHLCLRWG